MSVAVAGVLLGPSVAQAQCTYEVTGILRGPYCGKNLGYSPTIGRGINARGEIVGQYITCFSGPGEAFWWRPGAAPTPLKLQRPGGSSGAHAWDIGDGGIFGPIVGSLGVPGPTGPFAAVWENPLADPIDLGTLPDGNFSNARSVNVHGLIVGQAGNNSFGPLHAFLWGNGEMLDLGPALGRGHSFAHDVNDIGLVVGRVGSLVSDARAFIWQDGKVTILPPIAGGFTSVALAINNVGEIVGWGLVTDPDTGDTWSRAFYWKDGVMVNLGTLPGFSQSTANDVNDAGVVVGTGFMWRDGVMTDLNDLVPAGTLSYIGGAEEINNQGQMVGSAIDLDGNAVALLLTPVPDIPGDLTCDGRVLSDDLIVLINVWGDCPECPADLDGSGLVTTIDLLMLLANWG